MDIDFENSIGMVEAVCALVGAVAVILGGVWLIVRQAFNSGVNARRLEEIEKSISSLPCVLHGDDILKVKSVLMQRYPSSAGIFSMKASPRALNERGRQLFNDIGGANFLEENREVLFRSIAESRPLAALDVEQAAFAACSTLTSAPTFKRLKDFVCSAPAIEVENGKKHDISLSDICFVLSIPLRDMYLKDVGINR